MAFTLSRFDSFPLKSKRSVTVSKQSLLSRHFVLFNVITTVEFIMMELVLHKFGSKVCYDTTYIRELWTRDINLLVTGSFVLYSILQIFRLVTGVSYSHPDVRSIFYSSALITCIAAVGTSFTLFWPHPMCTDGNG